MFLLGLTTSLLLACACAVLSVFVVTRRWAFLGEGIAHAGFGGAGCAWMAAILVPALNNGRVTYVAVAAFSFLTALAFGFLERKGKVESDVAVGILLVGALAWGFLAQQVYTFVHPGIYPPGFDSLLFGHMEAPARELAAAISALSLGVLIVTAMFWKEFLAYAVDPQMAHLTGIKTSLIHGMLLLLITLCIVLGTKVTGSVLVTALLILPGATALQLGKTIRQTVMLSILSAVLAILAASLVRIFYPFLPQGPLIVLVLFVECLAACSLKINRAAERS